MGPIVPIIIGQLNADSISKSASIIRTHIDDNTLIIISSDFTHYGAAFNYTPCTNDIEKNLAQLDMGAIELIQNQNADKLQLYLLKKQATICGRYPILV